MSTEMIATIWAGLIAFAVLAYVVLDGFALGVGILFAAERGAPDRDTMVNSIAPMWDMSCCACNVPADAKRISADAQTTPARAPSLFIVAITRARFIVALALPR